MHLRTVPLFSYGADKLSLAWAIASIRLPWPGGFCKKLARQLLWGRPDLLHAAHDSVSPLWAALWLGQFKRLRRRGLLTYGSWLLASLALLTIGLPLPVVGVSVAFFIQGAAFAALGLTWMNSLQEFVPADLLGRVSSIDYLVSSALLPIGYGLAGVAADHLGASPIFVLGGAIAAATIALGLLHPDIRAVD